MRIVVAAVGRLKQGPERELAERYRKRAADAGRGIGLRGVEIVEIKESRAQQVDKRQIEESIALANVLAEGDIAVVLDERGDNLDSVGFSGCLKRWRDEGRAATTFIIGGADGMTASLRDQAALRLSFGKATWPHQFVRIMLLEQIYRAVTLLAGHPYHRS
jgi:23S rRNA (pseudouridine1915-N3)-methyltransferase